MLRSTAVSLIQEGLGFTTARENSIILRLQQAQRLLEKGRSLPWFLIQEEETFSATSGSDILSLPTGFIREVTRKQFRYVDPSDSAHIILLEKVTHEEGLTKYTGSDSGKPAAYTILNPEQVIIYPDRDTTYSLTWSYYAGAAVLNSDIENVWLEYAPDVLIGAAGALIADDLRDAGAKQKFSELFSAAWRGMFSEDIVRDELNDPIRVGGRL